MKYDADLAALLSMVEVGNPISPPTSSCAGDAQDVHALLPGGYERLSRPEHQVLKSMHDGATQV